MTKARSKAARRRKRPKSDGITLPDTIAPQSRTRGRPRAEDARATVKAARTRVFAWHPSLGDRPDPLEPLSGSQAGLCILAEGKARKTLEPVWNAISAAHRAYRTRVIGQTGEPKCAATPMLPDPVEVDPSLRVDLREPHEKDRAAKAAWLIWESRLSRLPAPQFRWAVNHALGNSIDPDAHRLWGKDGLPTREGRNFILALSHMAHTSG